MHNRRATEQGEAEWFCAASDVAEAPVQPDSFTALIFIYSDSLPVTERTR